MVGFGARGLGQEENVRLELLQLPAQASPESRTALAPVVDGPRYVAPVAVHVELPHPVFGHLHEVVRGKRVGEIHRREIAPVEQVLVLPRRLPQVKAVVGRRRSVGQGVPHEGMTEVRVLDDKIQDHTDSVRVSGSNQVPKVFLRPVLRVHGEVVGDPVAVRHGRRVDGHEPDARDAERRQFVHPAGDRPQLAGRAEAARVNLVQNQAVDPGRMPGAQIRDRGSARAVHQNDGPRARRVFPRRNGQIEVVLAGNCRRLERTRG